MVELVSPKGTIEKKLHLICKQGKSQGDFTLDEAVPGGLYKLRAYTNWMKNEGEQNYVEKEIQVQDVILPHLKMKLDFEKKAFGAGDEVIAKVELHTNENKALTGTPLRYVASLNGKSLLEQNLSTDEEGVAYLKFKLPAKLQSNDGLVNVMIDYNGSTESISRSIPIVLNKIQVTVFPEGGDLVNELSSKVAFKAVNEFGKPADVEGEVLNQHGICVTRFKSFHQGMGAFTFCPKGNERYTVKITKPSGVLEQVALPEALHRGYVMNVEPEKEGKLTVSIQSTESEELSLVAQVRGKMYYSTVINSLGGKNELSFSTEKFPMGVAQLTLFDARGIARAERLVFVNKHKQLSISVVTDKEKYLPREKVRMTFLVKDERGLPSPANLAVSVVNDQLLSFADDRSGTLLSTLFLQHDLKEKMEEPAFYFDAKEKKADQALDYLLLSSGWRRFTWEKLLEDDLPRIRYMGQKAILAGTVKDAQTGKSIPRASIKTHDGTEYLCDEQGKFSISNVDLSQALSVSLSAEGYSPQWQSISQYNGDMVMYLYKYAIQAIGRNRWDEEDQLAPVLERNVPQAAVQLGAKDEMKQVEVAAGLHQVKKNGPPMPIKAQLIVLDKPNKEPELASKHLHKAVFLEKRNNHEDLPAPDINDEQPSAPQVYYRARVFQSPEYAKQEPVEMRSDFRTTLYWNPSVEIGYSGRKTIEFYTSDDISSFKTIAEGMTTHGLGGRAEKNFFTQLPFELSTKIPSQLVSEDLVSIPITLKNNTNGPLGGALQINTPQGLVKIGELERIQTLMPGKAKTILAQYRVSDMIGEGEISVSFQSCGLSDAFSQKINIVAKGFPAQLSFSSQESEKEYEFELNKVVQGSLKASFTAFPNVVSDLMKGVEGILQEPYGCFEQTSCTAYPNAMVLDYLKNTDSKDTKTLARATDLLDRGYKRLTSFETSNKGYEWFGANPAHEGLTAYGIMEFVDMKKAGQKIDQSMLDRTVHWLMNHRDGKGGFEREKRALHDFGRISDEVLNAYIVYALAEAGYSDIKKEFESSYAIAVQAKDAYLLAMMANAAYLLKENAKAEQALKALLALQAKDGSFTGSSHSITYSQGSSLSIETSALSLMALLKAPLKKSTEINQVVQFLVSSRSGSGVFSSTQGTILALKALTEYAKFSKRTNEDGNILIYVDNKKVAEKPYKAGDNGAINIDGLEHFIKGDGKHSIKVKYQDAKTPLPYSLALNWNTSLPASDENCRLQLKTSLSGTAISVGETLRLSIQIRNNSEKEVPSSIALIGIPAGLSVQAWQLKELQEKQVFDYYEIKENTLALYYRGLDAKAVKEIKLDLKAEIPGTFEAPASAAYLYYTNEYKSWTSMDRVKIHGQAAAEVR